MKTAQIRHIFVLFVFTAVIASCRTYYQKTDGTEKAMVTKNYEKAEEVIRKNKFLTRKRNLLLYYLELGKVQHLQGDFEASNISLNLADLMMEEYRNLLEMAVGVTVNQAMQPYLAEPHEKILVHYYKALNYLQLGDIEEAIVEARRIDLSGTQNENDANGKDRKYGEDPFGLMLMGMIYEADRDYNNAFIAYRNAKKIYETDETGLYKGRQPESLERDLVRTSSYAGLNYESALEKTDLPFGEAIIFWENGLVPIKEEKNMFFSLNKENGNFFFVSDNLTVPINYNFNKDNPDFKPSDIGLLRMAWSFYVPRGSRVQAATITHNTKALQFYPIEDVSALAFQIERDNYLKELGQNLLRLSLKKISELSLSQQNEYLGLALGIANVATEKADTRNWQSLPSTISYTRIPLEKGTNTIRFTASNGEQKKFDLEGTGRMYFRNIVTY